MTIRVRAGLLVAFHVRLVWWRQLLCGGFGNDSCAVDLVAFRVRLIWYSKSRLLCLVCEKGIPGIQPHAVVWQIYYSCGRPVFYWLIVWVVVSGTVGQGANARSPIIPSFSFGDQG